MFDLRKTQVPALLAYIAILDQLQPLSFHPTDKDSIWAAAPSDRDFSSIQTASLSFLTMTGILS
jgi:hypothetical protein